jgi:hypothetical protein
LAVPKLLTPRSLDVGFPSPSSAHFGPAYDRESVERRSLLARIAPSVPQVIAILGRVGFDASPYKTRMLEEWVIRRMFHLDLGTAGDYLSRLESNETERSATG